MPVFKPPSQLHFVMVAWAASDKRTPVAPPTPTSPGDVSSAESQSMWSDFTTLRTLLCTSAQKATIWSPDRRLVRSGIPSSFQWKDPHVFCPLGILSPPARLAWVTLWCVLPVDLETRMSDVSCAAVLLHWFYYVRTAWPHLGLDSCGFLGPGCVGTVSTMANMTFLFLTASETVTPYLYSYCLNSEQSGMEHCFSYLPSTWHTDSLKGRYLILPSLHLPLLPSLFLYLLLWFPHMTLLFHCVSTLRSLVCPSALFFSDLSLSLLYFCLFVFSVASHCMSVKSSDSFPSHRPVGKPEGALSVSSRWMEVEEHNKWQNNFSITGP